MSFKVIVTSDFAKAVKRLCKKYPSFKKDYSSLVESIKENPLQGVGFIPALERFECK